MIVDFFSVPSSPFAGQNLSIQEAKEIIASSNKNIKQWLFLKEELKASMLENHAQSSSPYLLVKYVSGPPLGRTVWSNLRSGSKYKYKSKCKCKLC